MYMYMYMYLSEAFIKKSVTKDILKKSNCYRRYECYTCNKKYYILYFLK